MTGNEYIHILLEWLFAIVLLCLFIEVINKYLDLKD